MGELRALGYTDGEINSLLDQCGCCCCSPCSCQTSGQGTAGGKQGQGGKASGGGGSGAGSGGGGSGKGCGKAGGAPQKSKKVSGVGLSGCNGSLLSRLLGTGAGAFSTSARQGYGTGSGLFSNLLTGTNKNKKGSVIGGGSATPSEGTLLLIMGVGAVLILALVYGTKESSQNA